VIVNIDVLEEIFMRYKALFIDLRKLTQSEALYIVMYNNYLSEESKIIYIILKDYWV